MAGNSHMCHSVYPFGVSGLPDGVAVTLPNEDIVRVVCGRQHSALMCVSGRAYMFGSNSCGQLGLGFHSEFVYVPTLVSGPLKLGGIKDIACGQSFTLFLTLGGLVFACGSNEHFQLCRSNARERAAEPVQLLQTLTGVVQVAAGNYHAAALTEKGRVYVWGCNSEGQLGLGHYEHAVVPTVLPCGPVTYVSCGGSHTAVITETGDLQVCGANNEGQLGLNNRFKPLPSLLTVKLPAKVTSVAASQYHTLALLENGSVHAWGRNAEGQRGVGLKDARACPAPLTVKNARVKQIAAGEVHSALVTADCQLWTWGYGTDKQLCAANPYRTNPMEMTPPIGRLILQVACGDRHTLLLTAPHKCKEVLNKQLSTSHEMENDIPILEKVSSSDERNKGSSKLEASPLKKPDEITVGQNETDLSKLNTLVETKLRELESAERAIRCKEMSVTSRELASVAREEALDAREQLSDVREAAIVSKERQLDLEETRLADKWRGLDAFERHLVEHELCHEQDHVRFEGEMAEFENKLKALESRDVAITLKERNFLDELSSLEALSEEVEIKFRDLDVLRDELDARIARHELEERALESQRTRQYGPVTCPTCDTEAMCPPIRLCLQGHGFCDACWSVRSKSEFDVLNASCPDCAAIGQAKLLAAHRLACPSRPSMCVVGGPDCTWTGFYRDIVQHTAAEHKDRYARGRSHKFPRFNANERSAFLISAFDVLFVLSCRFVSDDQLLSATVRPVGALPTAQAYGYTLEVTGYNEGDGLLFRRHVRQGTNDLTGQINVRFDRNEKVVIENSLDCRVEIYKM